MTGKIKTAGIFFILPVLTLCVVFLPRLITEKSLRNTFGKIEEWHYDSQRRTELSSHQVAQLYYDGNLTFVYDTQNQRQYEENESVEDLMDLCFGSDKELCEKIKEILSGTGTISECIMLTIEDGRPVVLNYVFVSLSWRGCQLNFAFEERTKTLFLFNFELFYSIQRMYTADDGKMYMDLPESSGTAVSAEELAQDIEAALGTYYRSYVGIDPEMYYELSMIAEDMFSVEFHINQASDSYYENEAEEYTYY